MDPVAERLIEEAKRAPIVGQPPPPVQMAVVTMQGPEGEEVQVPMPLPTFILFQELKAMNEKFDQLIAILKKAPHEA